MSAILVLTIGPVQGYITQARRTQDLLQGSRILSRLAGAGLEYAMAQEAHGFARVIYPAATPQLKSIPNRIVVQWLGDLDSAQACAQSMADAIYEAWTNLSENTLAYFLKLGSQDQETRNQMAAIWRRQVGDWLECYWVVVPDAKQRTYSDNVIQANDAMEARKFLRNFPQIWEEGRKCSITGEHEILHGSGNPNDFWTGLREDQRNLSLFGISERLSAISTIKRLAHEEERDASGRWVAINPGLEVGKRFPSTSSIAAAPFKYDILRALDGQLTDGKPISPQDQAQLERALQTYVDALLRFFRHPDDLFFNKRGNYNEEYFGLIESQISSQTLGRVLVRRFRSIDGDFLFEDTLISKTIQEYSQQLPQSGDIKDARKALAALISTAKKIGISAPQPYLVILAMDGDHMGRTLGKLKDAGQHWQFSQILAQFALNGVMRIVEMEHLGRVVYAGGDDVLALLPVRGALQVAEGLRTGFEQAINNAHILDSANHPITATTSVGLAYVHHTHNLQDAVRAASQKALDQIAKGRHGRNAIGVLLLRRSGEPREMGQNWGEESEENPSLVGHVSELVKAFAKGVLSRNLPYEVSRIVYSMAGAIVPEGARKAELGRVIKRRLSDDTCVPQIVTHVEALSQAQHLSMDDGWLNAQHWLELARFIAQKESDR